MISCAFRYFFYLDRLPSAMRAPVQKRGHCRSVSHGGTTTQTSSVFNPSLGTMAEKYPSYSKGNFIN